MRRPDLVTEQLKRGADVWRSTVGLDDEELARLVRRDQIDVLVDLTMHLQGSRLLAFARKPAPVQVTYLAYCSTTGLDAMDYRLTDPYLDPPGGEERWYSERSVRLPRTYWCYPPPAQAGPLGPVPALASGRITFGCLNNYCKITRPTWNTWCGLLKAVPDSELIVHSHEGTHRERARQHLAQEGVDPRRLQFVGLLPLPQYFQQYAKIDIALDPFPYPGGTTSCDALWMGVPVVSLAARTAVSRAGLSILSNLGLAELVARRPEEYVRIAADLAADLSRLSELRASLRARMRESPLMNAQAFARDVETAFRSMWRDWCAARAPAR